MRRNRNMPIVALLAVFLLVFIIVIAIRHIKVYIVFSSGLGPFIIIGLIILLILFVFFKGL
ncbi:hypothetical protein EKG37_04125 [Robertmurraya yapensis]|uniref:Uncharacterized protein n=2 Tax=Bacillaceae TaxID=186817 RepID=A0A3S0K568_9BACI|nr:hypothetical protein [Bacillus yapensis]RTR35827.1 hypothetical protein EKG37_04125 [Bacillus yapensis]TKS98629.1 hypothetical protein FAR12_04125 [Bacillus yapensis]